MKRQGKKRFPIISATIANFFRPPDSLLRRGYRRNIKQCDLLATAFFWHLTFEWPAFSCDLTAGASNLRIGSFRPARQRRGSNEFVGGIKGKTRNEKQPAANACRMERR
jgi:hypothetical protein